MKHHSSSSPLSAPVLNLTGRPLARLQFYLYPRKALSHSLGPAV